MSRDTTLFILLTIMTALAIWGWLDHANCEACNMRFNKTNSDSINGVYSPEGYFCVWTSGRSMDDIMRTTTHELVHVMVREERTHFEVEK